MERRQQQRGSASGQGSLRIIGGDWRGRRLQFPELPGLRPSADRVRETVFNWLAPRIMGARCLDMFAGSGALGLEALSRGADHCTFIELQSPAARAIEQHLSLLNATARAKVATADALKFRDDSYDIVFVDPPFSESLVASALDHLLEAKLLAGDARVYVELGRSQPLPDLASRFDVLRDKQAGDVRYLLLTPRDLSVDAALG